MIYILYIHSMAGLANSTMALFTMENLSIAIIKIECSKFQHDITLQNEKCDAKYLENKDPGIYKEIITMIKTQKKIKKDNLQFLVCVPLE